MLSFREVYTLDPFSVPDKVKEKHARPWTSNEVLFNILMMVVAFIIIVTGIYLPDIHCTHWCCDNKVANKLDSIDLTYKPQESKRTLSQFGRDLNGSNGVVMVMENMFSGLANLSIPHNPIYTIAKLAAEIKDGVPLRKHKFPLITVSGKRGSVQELYMTVYMAQTLATPKASLILNGLTETSSAAFDTLTLLVRDEIIDWNPADMYTHNEEVWVSARFKNIDTSKSVSEYMHDIMTRYLELSGSSVRYYLISKEREDELRNAYKSDTEYTVTNITTAFHAAVLKVLFPNLKILMTEHPDDPVYVNSVEFLNRFILSS